jgi:hypothetical protein
MLFTETIIPHAYHENGVIMHLLAEKLPPIYPQRFVVHDCFTIKKALNMQLLLLRDMIYKAHPPLLLEL